jgi:hypothetical protein
MDYIWRRAGYIPCGKKQIRSHQTKLPHVIKTIRPSGDVSDPILADQDLGSHALDRISNFFLRVVLADSAYFHEIGNAELMQSVTRPQIDATLRQKHINGAKNANCCGVTSINQHASLCGKNAIQKCTNCA